MYSLNKDTVDKTNKSSSRYGFHLGIPLPFQDKGFNHSVGVKFVSQESENNYSGTYNPFIFGYDKTKFETLCLRSSFSSYI